MEFAIVFTVYLIGVIFGLAVIAYLNERKGEMYYPCLALASWTLPLVFLFITLDAALDNICDFFRFLFQEKARRDCRAGDAS